MNLLTDLKTRLSFFLSLIVLNYLLKEQAVHPEMKNCVVTNLCAIFFSVYNSRIILGIGMQIFTYKDQKALCM